MSWQRVSSPTLFLTTRTSSYLISHFCLSFTTRTSSYHFRPFFPPSNPPPPPQNVPRLNPATLHDTSPSRRARPRGPGRRPADGRTPSRTIQLTVSLKRINLGSSLGSFNHAPYRTSKKARLAVSFFRESPNSVHSNSFPERATM